MPATKTFSDMLQGLADTIVDTTTMKLCPNIITPQSIPTTGTDTMFSLDIQTANTNKYRDRDEVRVGHVLLVRFLKRLNMTDAFRSQKEALDLEERLIQALLDQSANPSIRVLYQNTRRSLTPTREHLLVEISFGIEQDFPVSAS